MSDRRFIARSNEDQQVAVSDLAADRVSDRRFNARSAEQEFSQRDPNWEFSQTRSALLHSAGAGSLAGGIGLLRLGEPGRATDSRSPLSSCIRTP